MHVIVATRETQGYRKDDFSWTVEGELVRLPGLTCDCPDCGCDRALAGLSSSKATTTVKVVDRADLDAADFWLAFRDALDREGWLAAMGDEGLVRQWADGHLALAAAFAAGTVLELRDDWLCARRPRKGIRA